LKDIREQNRGRSTIVCRSSVNEHFAVHFCEPSGFARSIPLRSARAPIEREAKSIQTHGRRGQTNQSMKYCVKRTIDAYWIPIQNVGLSARWGACRAITHWKQSNEGAKG